MSWGGSCKVIEIAAAFFTALYFGGWDAKPHLWQPLIMDERVIRALNRKTDREWEAIAGHFTDWETAVSVFTAVVSLFARQRDR
jgi:hypothetical protein